jgi:hypothetical protein
VDRERRRLSRCDEQLDRIDELLQESGS